MSNVLAVPNASETIQIINYMIESTKNDSIANMTADQKSKLLSSKIDVSSCLSNCSNNGVCKLSNGKYVCDCFPDFIGAKCQTNSRPCYYYPCLNNGTCTDILNENLTILNNQKVWDFICNCSQFYYGNRCQQKLNICENVTCSGNGHCIDNSSVASCKCYMYYSGAQCQNQSQILTTIKKAISVTAAVAITTLICFYSSFFIMDIIKLIKMIKSSPKTKLQTKNLPNKNSEKKVSFQKVPEYIS